MKRATLILAALVFLLSARSAHAVIIVFDTSSSTFNAGVDNQGWWSGTFSNFTTNDNYFVGRLGGSLLRNFFTFDLSSLNLAGQQVVSATLELTRYIPFGAPTHTYQLWDVSTGAAVLNNNTGTSAAIFADLGSGINYGIYTVGTGSSSDVLSFPLNLAGRAGVTAGAGGFFSIGGALDLTGQFGDQFLFGFSFSGGTQRLVLDVQQVETIPEPNTFALFGMVLACGVGCWFYQRRRAVVQVV